jgi:hypothetical protein
MKDSDLDILLEGGSNNLSETAVAETLSKIAWAGRQVCEESE